MRDVTIWNRALMPGEVAALASSSWTLTGTESRLMAWYPLNGSSTNLCLNAGAFSDGANVGTTFTAGRGGPPG